jgi:hypothetical protein
MSDCPSRGLAVQAYKGLAIPADSLLAPLTSLGTGADRIQEQTEI